MSVAISDNAADTPGPQALPAHGLSLRWRLALLVIAGIVPLSAFSLGNQYLQYREEIASTGRQTLALARSMSLLVERELQVHVAALQTLKVSRALQAGDLGTFRARAEAAVARQFPGANIVLLKENGQQVMNTILPPEAPLPIRPNLESTRQVFATGRPAVSNLYQGAVGPRPVVAIDVPVEDPDGTVAHVLSLNPRIEVFADVIHRERLPASWVISVFDRHGVIIARFPNGGRFVGHEAAPSLLVRLQAEAEGIVDTTSLEGIQLLTVFSRAEPFGWAVAIGVPRAELTGPALSEALRTLAIGGILLAVSFAMALFAARRIAGPIGSLRRLVTATDRDALLSPVPTGLREVDQVADAFRLAEEERRRSRDAEVVLRDGIETIPEGFSIYDDEDRLVMCNDSYRQLFADTPDHVVRGARYEDILRAGLARGHYPQATGHEEEWIADRLYEHHYPGGSIEQQLADGRWVLVTKRQLSGGSIAGLRIDITALKAAQTALRDSERRFQDIAEVSGDWIWETDREHRFTLVFSDRTGATPLNRQTMIGRTRWEFAGADSVRDEPWVKHKAELDAHRPFRYFRYEVRMPDGGQMHVLANGKPIFDDAQNFLGYRGTATDETAIVTAQLRAEEAEALLRRVFDTSQDLILITDHNGNFVRVSPSAMLVLGYRQDEMVGRSAEQFLYSEDLANTRDEMRLARRAGTAQSFECRYVHKGGRIVTLWWKGVWSASEKQYFFIGRDITDHKETDRRLRDSERRFQDIAEVSGDWMWETDREHRFTLLVGDRIEATPLDREALIGRTRWEISGADPVTDEPWVQHKAGLDAHQAFRSFRYEVPTPDNGRMYIAASGKPVFDDAHNFLGYRGAATDETAIVTAQRRAEEAEALLQDAIESISGGFLICDAEDRVVLFNQQVEVFFPDCAAVLKPGVPYRDFLWDRVQRGYYPPAVGKEGAWFSEAIARHRAANNEVEIRLPDGRWLLATERRMRNGGIASVSLDISTLKAALNALANREEQLKRAQRLGQMGSNLSDVHTGAIEWSDETYRIYGVSRDTFVLSRANILNMIHPDDRAQVLASMNQRKLGLAPAPFEYRLIRPEGTVRYIYGESEIIKDEDANPRYVAGVIHDITALKVADEALRESEQAARGIIESALDAVVQMDQAGIITEWNRQAEVVFGWSRSEALGRTLSKLIIPPGNRARHETGLARFLATGQSTILGKRFVIDASHRDGREIKVELAITALRRGTSYVFNGFLRDLTQQITTEEQLRQAQKMEAIGNLTGGMAHDFNNFLGIIVGNLDLARERIGDDEEQRELIGEALEAAWRGADLTRRLLAFARRQPLRPTVVDVNELVGNTVRLLRHLLGEDIEISLDLADDTWPVIADPAQLEASLTNLATNARDAMPKGGRLIVATGNRHLDADYAAEHADATEGDFAMIEITDTGLGIPAEIMSQIFEPFFTTKEVGQGTGLGLSMVFGFLRQSGGHVYVYSEPGVGTTFRLYLPRTPTESSALEAREQDPVARGAGETVLVVEDNPAMRRIVLRQIRELGYRVLETDRAAAALEVLQREPVDLLFTDIVMPGGLDGLELARIARERWSKLKIVLTSGFPQARVDENGELRGGLRLLSKPYTREELAAVLRTAFVG